MGCVGIMRGLLRASFQLLIIVGSQGGSPCAWYQWVVAAHSRFDLGGARVDFPVSFVAVQYQKSN